MDHTLDLESPKPSPPAARPGVRGVDVMLGLCRGFLADGVIAEAEAQLLRAWIRANPEVAGAWPGNVVAARLERIYADGRVDEAERADLAELLKQLVGPPAPPGAGRRPSPPLPLDRPPPPLSFAGRVFVLAGKFARGSLRQCERLVEERGGRCEPGVTRETDFVVVGTFTGAEWMHTSYGRTIRKAAHFRRRGCPIAIVPEDYWAACL